MNKLHAVGFLAALSCLTVTDSHARRVIDEIVARVNGVNILRSDLRIPRITKDGAAFSLDEAINEELFYQIACKRNILPKEADIDRQIVAFKMHHNLVSLNDEDFDKELREGTGISLKEYKLQLGRWFAVDNIKRVEINEKIVVTAQEVENYYTNNPEYSQERFKLAIATVPADHSQDNTDGLVWEDLGWIEKENLNDSFRVVETLKPGQVSDPIQHDDGTTIQRLKLLQHQPSALKTLDERYAAVEKVLQDERKEVAVNSLEKDIRAKAVIVYLAQEEEQPVVNHEAATEHITTEITHETENNQSEADQESETTEEAVGTEIEHEELDADHQKLIDDVHALGETITEAHATLQAQNSESET